jgi:hypothetical protein
VSLHNPTAEIEIARGDFYLSRELCDAYLPGTEAVALIAREGAVWIVPLARTSAGGLLLKRRNLRGDRVIHAQEFIREKGLPEHFEPRAAPVRWDPDRAALSIEGLLENP